MAETLEPRGQEGTMVAPFASMYVFRATAELALRNEVPPITRDELNLIYAMLRVLLKRAKDTSQADRKLALQLLDWYLDERLIPLLGVDTNVREIASHLKFQLGKHFVVLPVPHVSQSRNKQLEKLCKNVGSAILDMTVVALITRGAGREAAATLTHNAIQHVVGDESLQADVKERAVELLSADLNGLIALLANERSR